MTAKADALGLGKVRPEWDGQIFTLMEGSRKKKTARTQLPSCHQQHRAVAEPAVLVLTSGALVHWASGKAKHKRSDPWHLPVSPVCAFPALPICRIPEVKCMSLHGLVPAHHRPLASSPGQDRK